MKKLEFTKNTLHGSLQRVPIGVKYCSACGKELERHIPPGDTLERYVCPVCQSIHYCNPKIIVGSLPVWQEDKILLCRRAIEPRKGLWTLPSGFMEEKESAQEGAVRETQEEANANILIQYLHTLYNIAQISQVYLIFKAELVDTNFSCGPESLEVELFSREDIPWEKIAFSAIHYCLERFFEDLSEQKRGGFLQKTHCGSYAANEN